MSTYEDQKIIHSIAIFIEQVFLWYLLINTLSLLLSLNTLVEESALTRKKDQLETFKVQEYLGSIDIEII